MSSGDSKGSPSTTSTSRPIPINKARLPVPGTTSAESNEKGFGMAQSCPAPRAPIIGSMPAPSMLANRMPNLELPPQSPDAGSSSMPNHGYAQSAPAQRFLLSSKKPILHELRIRDRSDSEKSDSRYRRSLRGEGGSSIEDILYEEEEEDLHEDEGENTQPSSMEVFSAIRSITQTETTTQDIRYVETSFEKVNLEVSAKLVDSELPNQDPTLVGMQEKLAQIDDDDPGDEDVDFEEQFEMDGVSGASLIP
mmetsp:Transcript_4210/g.6166  ORF Transcript_4210/g.6166 Transcript_4210/m.6166 type:complete len:251 (+) Transcript_4210:1688-2440(+)|eukprot:CAMPEP_0203761892 /NCGR_PEP_ID=MMETSP0098-20131031/14889_1 /ASSEMBLY_ACC=CAM_ASM_000208 /TAXON_ID=96639 /ORGANISM=" , Strain NY0313808BC1" /LENGTH=250 /DNA_ID=CAMNT_0050656075 /DNA_START=244 /DNA_END=996 /DNA_ORIENTATION=+